MQARISVQPAHFRFKEYADYRFIDPFTDADRNPLRIDEALTPAVTDADGMARFDIPLNRFREGTYQLDFYVEGFDPGGGRSVSAQNRTMISPLPHLVGFKSDGDLTFIHAGSDTRVDWIAIAPTLDTLALSDLTLTRLEIQHLSTLVKQPDGTFKYQTVDREREIDSQPFAIAETGTRYTLATDAPGDYAIEIHGQVNGVSARRSPGSVLKPFVYALAMDQGLIHPASLMKDSPRRYGGFTPENFDQRFLGPLSAHDALILSRNLPAANLQAQLQNPGLHEFLQQAGIANLQPASFYGLALSLGGVEVSMLELARLYAALANGGRLRPIRIRSPTARSCGPRKAEPSTSAWSTTTAGRPLLR